MKKSSFLIVSLFFSFLIIGGLFWWTKNLLPVDAENKEKIFFSVNKGDGLAEIAGHLHKEGLIRDTLHFRFLSVFLRTARRIKAGGYYLSLAMSSSEIAKELTRGVNDQWVTVVEGLRSEEIGQLLIKKGFGIDPLVWDKTIKADGLEGTLFPDSYLLPAGADQTKILQIFSRNFQKKVVNGLKEEFSQSNLSLKEVLTLASIVEREVKHEADRVLVAGILLKRLKNSWPLQVDATVQYALALKGCTILTSPCDWWPAKLGTEDLKIKSSYNTYLNRGLPPFPICNPGLSAIKAVLNFKDSSYWFYLSDPQGNIYFAKTAQEHAANISKYLR